MVHKEQFETTPAGLLVRAPAKVNLCLLIAGKRSDGFHEIETLMAKVNFYDHILIEPAEKPGIHLVCTGPCWAPQAPQNLVYYAAERLIEASGTTADIKITLTKNIPAGSGLGSASSDAAATLIGLNRFLNIELTTAQIAPIAVGLGADVPFFLNGPLALCTGKGEKIKKINENFNFAAILILPDVNCSTKKVYENYQHDAVRYANLSGKINRYIEKNRIDLAARMCANMLDKSCFQLYRQLAGLKMTIDSLCISPLCLSGSGSGMFCLLSREQLADAAIYQEKITKTSGCATVLVNSNNW